VFSKLKLYSLQVYVCIVSANPCAVKENCGAFLQSFMEMILGLRHFLAPKGAEKLSGQGKQVDELKMPETLVNTRFVPN